MRKNLRPKTSFSMNYRLSATDNKVGLSRILGREYQLKETLASCLTEMLIFRINFLNDIYKIKMNFKLILKKLNHNL